MNFKKYSSTGLFFGFVHLAFAIWIYAGQPYDGLWGYVFLAIPDLPVAVVVFIIQSVISFDNAWPLFFIFGTIWWYFVGAWFKKYVIR